MSRWVNGRGWWVVGGWLEREGAEELELELKLKLELELELGLGLGWSWGFMNRKK